MTVRIAVIVSLVVVGVTSTLACGENPSDNAPVAAVVVADVAFTSLRPKADVSSVSLSPDAKYLAVSSRIWEPEPVDEFDVLDVATGRPVGLPLPDGEKAGSAWFSPDGATVAVATSGPGLRHMLRVLDLAAERPVYTYDAKGWAPGPVVFSADSKSIVRPGRDESNTTFAFEVVNLSDGKTTARVIPDRAQLAHGEFHELRLSPSGEHLLTRQDEWVLAWSLQAGQQTLRWQWTGNGAPAAMAIVPGTTQVRVVAEEGTVVTLDYTSSREVSRVRLDLPPVERGAPRQIPFIRPWSLQNVAFSPDGNRLLKSEPGRIVRWDVRTGRKLPPVSLAKWPRSVAYMDSFVSDMTVINQSDNRRSDLAVVRVPSAVN